MPELPEVEAVCRKLRREAVGAVIGEAHVLRPRMTHPQHPSEFTRTAGHTITNVERRGKNILVHLSGGVALWFHLRMSGNLFVIPDARFHSARVRAYFRLEDGRGLVFEDSRALGRMTLHADAELDLLLKDVGMEPLSKAFTVDALAEMARHSKKPAKLFLMDQTRIAGIGNIYAAESLFRARINPKRAVNSLRRPKIQDLHSAILDVLREAVKLAVRSYNKPDSYQEMDFAVYGRKGEACRVCGRKILRMLQGGRSTYYCPGCQR
jgi:formamidopyrimidine-DNA glycosylase